MAPVDGPSAMLPPVPFGISRLSWTLRPFQITVIWNGVKVQDNIELPRGTGGNIAEGPSTGAIRLQDHGNKVQYRNIWIEPNL